MNLSAISGQRISKQSEAAWLRFDPTPVISVDLDVHWARAWENLLQGGENTSFSFFLAAHHRSAVSVSPWGGWPSAGTEVTALIIQPPRAHANWTALTTFGVGEPHRIAPGFADLVGRVGQSVLVFEVKRSIDPARVVSQIREWADLSATEIASIMGVSRRSLYHWLGSGRVSSENRERLFQIAEALRPLAREWQPVRLKSWLRKNRSEPVRLLKAGKFAAFRRLADETLAEASVPVRSARRLTVSEPEPPEYTVKPLGLEERRTFFDALFEPRRSAVREPWAPRELTDSLPAEDE
jgi:transcriptional regulator with XRE-family HTH domain